MLCTATATCPELTATGRAPSPLNDHLLPTRNTLTGPPRHTPLTWMPRDLRWAASFISRTRPDAASSALDGTQPRLTQVPPMSCPSITATFRPCSHMDGCIEGRTEAEQAAGWKDAAAQCGCHAAGEGTLHARVARPFYARRRACRLRSIGASVSRATATALPVLPLAVSVARQLPVARWSAPRSHRSRPVAGVPMWRLAHARAALTRSAGPRLTRVLSPCHRHRCCPHRCRRCSSSHHHCHCCHWCCHRRR